MSENKKELAAKMAAERSQKQTRKPLPGGPQQQRNSLSFFGEEADGWNVSPKAILLCSVAYMGCVILLHIFGKVASMKSADKPTVIPEPETGGTEDL